VRTAEISCSGGSSFEDKPAHAVPECSVDVFVKAKRCEDQDTGAVVSGEDPPSRLEPIELRHPDVHQDDGWIKPGRLGDRFEPVSCLCDDFNVLFASEQHPEAGPDHGLVVGDQDADRHRGSGSGSRVLRMKPPPFAAPAVMSPP
jgi:hypothetical protein